MMKLSPVLQHEVDSDNQPSRLSILKMRPLALLLTWALLTAPTATAINLDLADIVGGGDGTGTGAMQGIDTNTGDVITVHANPTGDMVNIYHPVPSNPLVDGVFVPDGDVLADAIITVTSTGLTVTGISDTIAFGTPGGFNHTLYDVWNGERCSVHCINYPGPLISAWGAQGITFDLDAIEAAHGGVDNDQALVLNLTASNSFGPDSFPTQVTSFHIFVDGLDVGRVSLIRGTTFFFDPIYLDPDDRFVTLITSAEGSIVADFQYWLEPEIQVPEPSVAVGLCAGLVSLASAARSRRQGAAQSTEVNGA